MEKACNIILLVAACIHVTLPDKISKPYQNFEHVCDKDKAVIEINSYVFSSKKGVDLKFRLICQSIDKRGNRCETWTNDKCRMAEEFKVFENGKFSKSVNNTFGSGCNCAKGEYLAGITSRYFKKRKVRKFAYECCKHKNCYVPNDKVCHHVGPTNLLSQKVTRIKNNLNSNATIFGCARDVISGLQITQNGLTVKFCPHPVDGAEYQEDCKPIKKDVKTFMETDPQVEETITKEKTVGKSTETEAEISENGKKAVTEKACNEIESPIKSTYYNGACFTVSYDFYTFADAETDGCTVFSNGHMAYIKDLATRNYIHAWLKKIKRSKFWVGLERKIGISGDTWFWQDGTEQNDSDERWAVSLPVISGPQHACGVIIAGHLIGEECDMVEQLMCQYDKKTADKSKEHAAEITEIDEKAVTENACNEIKVKSTYYNNACFTVSDDLYTFDEAKNKGCNMFSHGHLTYIKDNSTINHIMAWLKKIDMYYDIWMGMERKIGETTDKWLWHDGTDASHTDVIWKDVLPEKGVRTKVECGFVSQRGMYVDECTWALPIMCQYDNTISKEPKNE